MRYVIAIIFAIWLGLLYATVGGYLGSAMAGILGLFGAGIALWSLRKGATSRLIAHKGFFWTVIASFALPVSALIFASEAVEEVGGSDAEQAGAAIGAGIGVILIGVVAFFLFVIAIVGWFMTKGGKDASVTTCPKCAEDVKVDAQVCKHCGADLTMPVATATVPEPDIAQTP